MKSRTKLIGLIALIFIAAALLWSTNRDEPLKQKDKATTQSPNVPSLPVVVVPTKAESTPSPNPMQVLMQTPIDFYGIVLDQDGSPVPSAKVSATVLDNMIKGSPISTSSDATGKFGIKSRGRSLHIEVSKPGYYFVEKGGALKPSSQGFDFGVDNGKGIYQPDQASPSIFHLRKAGNAIALDRLTANPKVPRDGTPITVSPSKTSTVGLQLLC
ncbi:MAG: carboxypeptidase-like regulatory domain-containing protein, partial [Verrucomicrobiota bacterium]